MINVAEKVPGKREAATVEAAAVERLLAARNEEYVAAQARLFSEYAKDRTVLLGKLKKARQNMVDLWVLVRPTSRGTAWVYHSADHPCGRVTGSNKLTNHFQRFKESDHRMASLARCTACQWHRATAEAAEELAKGV